MKKNKLLAFAILVLISNCINAQSPSFGTTGFNNSNYDQVPFASGIAYPSVMTATNVAGTGWNFHIGALGVYVITQLDHSNTSSYDGAITASDVTPNGQPKVYQTFGFSTPGLTKFKLNSVKVKISNSSSTPVLILLAGIVGTSAGGTQSLLALPGSNWYTLNTSTDPNFYNINGVLLINGNGTSTVSTAVAEMAIDDINISSPIAGNPLPVFTNQPTDKTICSTGSTSFTGTASNATSYFWLISTDGLIWNPINASNAGSTFSGYNTNTLTVANPNIALNGLYLSVTAANSTGGNQSSNAVRLYVTNAPNSGTITGGNTVCVGSNLSLSSTVSGGVWSVLGGRATINSSGVITATSAGTTSVKYTVGSGTCTSSTIMALTVNPLPGVPTITFANGTRNISNSSGYCTNKTFTLVGTPNGGNWSSTGGITINPSTGVVNTGASTGPFSVTYTYTNSNGCSNKRTANANLVVCASKHISSEKLTNDYDFTAYPNPCKNYLYINLKNVVNETKAIMYDLMGMQVKVQNLSIGRNAIDVNELSKGLYTLKISSADSFKIQKIVIE